MFQNYPLALISNNVHLAKSYHYSRLQPEMNFKIRTVTNWIMGEKIIAPS